MIAGHILSLRPVELLARLALVHLASLVLDLETFLESATSGDPRRSSRRTDPPTDPPGEADSAEDNPPPGDGHPDPSSGGSSAGAAIGDALRCARADLARRETEVLGLRASLATTQGLLDEIRELVGCEPVDDGDTRRGIVRAVARLTHAQCECGHPRGLHFERNGALNRLVACSACACRVFRQRGGAS